jgi:hypothetical protein
MIRDAFNWRSVVFRASLVRPLDRLGENLAGDVRPLTRCPFRVANT